MEIKELIGGSFEEPVRPDLGFMKYAISEYTFNAFREAGSKESTSEVLEAFNEWYSLNPKYSGIELFREGRELSSRGLFTQVFHIKPEDISMFNFGEIGCDIVEPSLLDWIKKTKFDLKKITKRIREEEVKKPDAVVFFRFNDEYYFIVDTPLGTQDDNIARTMQAFGDEFGVTDVENSAANLTD